MSLSSLHAVLAVTVVSLSLQFWARPASAQTQSAPAPYNRLNLSPNQADGIRKLDREWKNNYMRLQPTLMGEQRRLVDLLGKPKADPLEITTTQQHINSIKEQLSGYATTNYLKKRRLLTPGQQRQVEGWMRRMMLSRTNDRSAH